MTEEQQTIWNDIQSGKELNYKPSQKSLLQEIATELQMVFKELDLKTADKKTVCAVYLEAKTVPTMITIQNYSKAESGLRMLVNILAASINEKSAIVGITNEA
jgi:hypothetical protein